MRGRIRSRAGGCRSSDTISAPRPWIRPCARCSSRPAATRGPRTSRLLDAARPALEALAAAGIRTMLLKGAVLASPPYGEPGLRPIGDVDVLVEPVHARRATRILEELGWVAWRGYSERDLSSPTVSICRSRRTERSTCTGIYWRSAAGQAPMWESGNARSR